MSRERFGDARIELATGAFFDDLACGRSPGPVMRDLGYVCDVDDSHRQQQRLPGEALGTAFAVPAFTDLFEGRTDIAGHPYEVCDVRRDVADCESVLFTIFRPLEEHVRDAARSLRKPATCTDFRDELGEHVQRIGDVEGDHQIADRDVVTGRHERNFVREGRTSRVREQRRVVDVPQGVVRQAMLPA